MFQSVSHRRVQSRNQKVFQGALARGAAGGAQSHAPKGGPFDSLQGSSEGYSSIPGRGEHRRQPINVSLTSMFPSLLSLSLKVSIETYSRARILKKGVLKKEEK